MTIPMLPKARSTTPALFDHVVFIAMENEDFSNVLGNGTQTSCASQTNLFICSLLPVGSTASNYCSYYFASDGTCHSSSSMHCSAACYTMVTSGADITTCSDGTCNNLSNTNIFDQIASATNPTLQWKGFCEDNCPRGSDHFPPLQYTSSSSSDCTATYQTSENCFVKTCTTCTGSAVKDDQLIYELGHGHANYIWFTPTDCHNMHGSSTEGCSSSSNTDCTSSSVQTACIPYGDNYLKQILVGGGTLASPDSNSILGSTLLTSPSYRTLLYIWWDENQFSPNLQLGKIINSGLISNAASNEYSTLHMVESNFGLSALANAASASTMSDLFTSLSPTANFDNTWFLNPSPASGSVVLLNGAAVTGLVSPDCYNFGCSGSSATYYDTVQKGSFPWGSIHGALSVPNNASVSINTALLSATRLSNSRYHLFIALYYQLGSAVTGCNRVLDQANGSCTMTNGQCTGTGCTTSQWFDSQIRVENIGGANSAIGTQDTYDPNDASGTYTHVFGYDEVFAQTNVGQAFTVVNFRTDVLFQRAAKVWGVSLATAKTLVGVEIGLEGYDVETVSATLFSFSFSSGVTQYQPGLPVTVTDCRFADTDLVDGANQGKTVDIVDAATMASAFGSKIGQSSYEPLADTAQIGKIDIVDAAIVAYYFDRTC